MRTGFINNRILCLKMKFNSDLSAVHAYLCADGYVIRNPVYQKHKYYKIGFRNTNLILLKDFQRRFKKYFKKTPILVIKERCYIGSKEIFYVLTKKYSYYSYEWNMPQISKENLRLWLRAFFDCESWVELQPAKSRSIRVECVNLKGLKQVQKALSRFKIESKLKIRIRKDRIIYRLNICGLDDLKRFNNNIGFLHPNKKIKLKEALNSYQIAKI